MRVVVCAVGRLKAGPERDLCARYAERFSETGRNCGFDGLKLVELAESPARRSEDRKREEGAAVQSAWRAALPKSSLVVLDERGATLSTEDFVAFVQTRRDAGADLAFVIGGPDGLDEALRTSADLVLGFGRLTIPHQLVRALLLEQLYRVATILSHHPYHRR